MPEGSGLGLRVEGSGLMDVVKESLKEPFKVKKLLNILRGFTV